MYEQETIGKRQYEANYSATNATPKNESEFERESRDLSNSTERLSSIISKLEERLSTVLHIQVPPNPSESLKDVGPTTGLGQFIRSEREKVNGSIRKLTDILSRVGI